MSVMQFLETVYSDSPAIDKENGVVRGVKVLGRESANSRTYSDQAMDDAARLYEGTEVNIDHDRKEPHRERGLLEGFGVLKNVSRKSDGVYADLHFLKSHPATNLFLERADRFPDKIGLSHNADGKANRKGGRLIVESISRVNSVDVVRNPATNKGLFESKELDVSKSTIKQILESAFPKTFKGCGLLEEDAAMAAMPVEAPAGGSSDDQIWAAFKQAIMAAVDDDKLDIKATLKKIGDILKSYDKLTGSSSSGGDSKPAGEGESPKMESKQLTELLESVNALKADLAARDKRDKARGIMAELNVAEDAAFLESLLKLPDEKAMRELCEREAKLRPAGRKAKPFIESKSGSESPLNYPKDAKEFAAALR
jgi:hypothetical protein